MVSITEPRANAIVHHVIDDHSTMTCHSLYATARLARLLQRVKDRLRPAKDRESIRPLARRVTSEEIEPHMQEVINRSPCRPAFGMHRRSGDQSCGTANPTRVQSLLQELDVYATKRVPLPVAAADDKLFVQASAFGSPLQTDLTGLRRIVDICNALLASISRLSYQRKKASSHFTQDDAATHPCKVTQDFTCEKFLANLEHLLLWQRQAALDAIVHHYLAIVEGSLLHFYQQWLYCKRALHDWFSEWPNGQRPLNTTWPWNVKPSLIVLWGVCWMFYDHKGTTDPFDTKADQFGQDIWMRQATTSSQVEAQAQLAYSQPPTLQSNAPIEQAGASSYANYAWLQPFQATAPEARRASISIPVTPSPAIVTSDSSPSYIGVTSSGSSNPFPATSFGTVWAFGSGSNQQQATTLTPDSTYWQTALNQGQSSVPNPFATVEQTPATPQTYAPHQIRSLSAGPPGPSSSHLGYSLTVQTKNMQDYPSPQLSDISVPGEPAYATPQPPLMDGTSTMFKPSNLSSPSSIMSNEGFRDVLRDAYGNYVCSEPNCPDGNPGFARKCEYTKHVDKHLRPYICDEPSCVNLRGFTYTGGLLRHKREVHRLNGGPRAACFCPHKDCKRSSGVGFSRKENLAEHLRRVHRDTNSKQPTADETMETPEQVQTVAGTRKRRRRVAEEVEDDDEDNEGHNGQSASQSPQDLRQEVKRLRRELQEKDDRLKRVEEQVERLLRAQQ